MASRGTSTADLCDGIPCTYLERPHIPTYPQRNAADFCDLNTLYCRAKAGNGAGMNSEKERMLRVRQQQKVKEMLAAQGRTEPSGAIESDGDDEEVVLGPMPPPKTRGEGGCVRAYVCA